MRGLTPEDKRTLKALFGNPTRVLLAAWALDQGSAAFYQAEALTEVERLGGSRTQAEGQLRVLVEHGLLEASEPRESERRVYYAVSKEHPAWGVFRAAVKAFALDEEDG